MPVDRCCKTCEHWDVESAKDKAGRVRSDRAAKCQFAQSEQGQSVIRSLPYWVGKIEIRWTPALDGSNCRAWARRQICLT